MLVSIILPCYNPRLNWAANIISEYRALVALTGEELEVILVEDGFNASLSAGVAELKAAIPSFKCIRYEQNRGKGYAIRRGVTEAQGELIIYTDIDFPYTTESFIKIFSALRNKECDIAVGIKNDAYYEHVPWFRRVLSKGLRRMIRFFLSIPITDTQCGLKGFTKAIKPVFLQTTIERYLFDLEFIRMSYRRGYSIKPIKIQLNENVHFSNMSYRILLPEALNFMKLLFKAGKQA